MYGDISDEQSGRIFETAKSEFTRLDSLLNRYSSKSEIYRINESPPGSIRVSRELIDILKRSFRWRDITDGLLEPKIGHLVELWGIGSGTRKIPSHTEVDSVMKSIRESRLNIIDDTSIAITGDISLDLGAFAKGYAVDMVYN
ncbi:hypothetical protein DRQ33_04140, partial [bacterium]